MARVRAGGCARVLLLALLVLGLEARAGGTEEWTADVVYLLDVSRSMNRAESLERACAVVRSHLESRVVPGTRVVLLPFPASPSAKGAGFVLGADAGSNGETRRAIASYLDSLQASGGPGDLGPALARGLKMLSGAARAGAPRLRELILLTRGGVCGEDPSRLLAQADSPEFRRGVDWRVTYAHFVEPDVRLAHALRASAADAVVPLDRLSNGAEWAATRMMATDLDLGQVPFGNWRRKVRLAVNSDRAAVGRKLRVALGRSPLPKGLEVAIKPASITIQSALQDLEFEVEVRGARPGARVEIPLVVGGDPSHLHGADAGRIDLEFEVRPLRIEAGGATVDFGSVSPGASFRHAVPLRPEASDQELDAEVRLEWAKSDSSTWLSAAPVRLKTGAAARMDLRLEIPPDAPSGPGELTVRLTCADPVEFTPEWLTISYRVEPGRVGTERDEVTLAAAVAGKVVEGVVNLRSTPGAWGREIEVTVQQPDGDDCRFEVPNRVTLEETTRVPIRFLAEEGAAPGDRVGVLRLVAPPGVVVEPHALPLAARVVDAKGSALRLPETVDFGTVTPTNARRLDFPLEFTATEGEAGGWLTIRSLNPAVTLEKGEKRLVAGANVVPLRLQTQKTEFGRQECRMEIWLEHGRASGPVAQTTIRWEVLRAAPVRVDLALQLRSDPVPLRAGEERIVMVALTPEALDGAVDLKLEFARADLPAGIRVDCPEFAKVSGESGEQLVPIRIRVDADAPAGEWYPLLSVQSASAGVELGAHAARIPISVEAGFLARFGRELLLGAIGLVVLISMLSAYLLQRRRPEGVYHEVVRVQLRPPPAVAGRARPTWDEDGFESDVVSRERVPAPNSMD